MATPHREPETRVIGEITGTSRRTLAKLGTKVLRTRGVRGRGRRR
jgi:aspartokinase